MPIQEFGSNKRYSLKQALPHSLEHSPIYAMPYQAFDGMYRKETDARYLSVGISQWSRDDISLKVMRYRNQWSRQAEELPLHRVVDTSIFLAKVLFDRENDSVEVERSLFTDQHDGFRIEKESISGKDEESFNEFLSEHTPALRERFNKLYQLLSTLKVQGKL